MSAPQPCDRTDPHGPHFHRWNSKIMSCGGIDPEQGHAGDRDQPDSPEFDWTPEQLHLSDAAAFVVRLHRNEDAAVTGRAQYLIGIEVWMQLTGMQEPEALTYAYAIATSVPPVLAASIPF